MKWKKTVLLDGGNVGNATEKRLYAFEMRVIERKTSRLWTDVC